MGRRHWCQGSTVQKHRELVTTTKRAPSVGRPLSFDFGGLMVVGPNECLYGDHPLRALYSWIARFLYSCVSRGLWRSPGAIAHFPGRWSCSPGHEGVNAFRGWLRLAGWPLGPELIGLPSSTAVYPCGFRLPGFTSYPRPAIMSLVSVDTCYMLRVIGVCASGRYCGTK
jgi:hypothetical protein